MSGKFFRLFTNRWAGYPVTIILVALATWLKYLAQPNIIPADVPILYIVAIVLTSAFYGFGPSIICCLLSMVAFDYFFLSPNFSLTFEVAVLPITLIFLLTGLTISYLSLNMRKKIEETKKENGIRRQREAELSTLNKKLQLEITDNVQIRKMVETERKRFYDVLEMLPVYVILLAPDYHVPFANKFFRDRFGESNGKRCYEYLFGRQEPCENCETYTVLKTNQPYHWEWTGPDGRDYDINDYPFRDVDGSPLIMEVGIDISRRKQAQAALKKAYDELEQRVRERTAELSETRDYLDKLFNYANAPIVVWDPQYKISRFNHAFERLARLAADEVMGKNIEILFPENTRDASMKHIKEATAGTRLEVVEIPIKQKGGSTCILLWNSAAIYAPDGRDIIAVIAQGQDITERKKAEQIKDDFLSMVSHELRTPMTIINGSLRILRTEGIAEKDKEILLENAISGADSLSAIMENLLELSRYQAGRLKINIGTVDIPAVTRNIIKGFNERNHRLEQNFPPGFPTVTADKIRVERILHNLVSNAIKYSPENTAITVSGRQGNGHVIISVADQGAGIKPEDRERIFEPFERLEHGKGIQGLGIGLVVCKRLTEAQGGKIWVESQPGKGSTFFFTLPSNGKSG